MTDAEFMSGWDDAPIVAQRLAPTLQTRGISSSIVSCTVAPLSDHSGLSGELSLLELSFDDDTSMELVLKRTRSSEDSKKSSKKLGLYREGMFYSMMGPLIQQRLDKVSLSKVEAQNDDSVHQQSFIPQALFSASDAETGQKAIVLDYFSDATEAGVYFPHSVHNVVREIQMHKTVENNDLTSDNHEDALSTEVIRKHITLDAARIAAMLHGSFYQDSSLLIDTSVTKYLRMADWIQGQGKESFVESQKEIVDRWFHAKARWRTGEFFDGKVQFGKEFVEIMDASCALALDFDLFLSKWKVDKSDTDNSKVAWSLVHGDYHPGNFLCLNEKKTKRNTPGGLKLILVDWEVVGVGSGPQDIGQFLISHTETQEAFNILDEVAMVYRQTLISTLDAVNERSREKQVVPSLESIRREIVYGGIERWVWLFGYMAGWEESMPWLYMQFFHDQMQKFIVINGISAKDVGMPRP